MFIIIQFYLQMHSALYNYCIVLDLQYISQLLHASNKCLAQNIKILILSLLFLRDGSVGSVFWYREHFSEIP